MGAILRPHTAVVLVLLPVSVALIVQAFAVLGTDSPISYAAYGVAAYTLTVLCIRIPDLLRAARDFKENNRYVSRWFSDVRLRVMLTLYATLLWNTAYAALLLALGIYHRSLWYYAMSTYYFLLALMRMFLFRHTRRHTVGERMREELVRYRLCGWIFLAMNLALIVIILMTVFDQREFAHHEITTIAMATYTVISFVVAVVNMVRYRRYGSPVYEASKTISLAAASVSVLSMTSSMLSTFGDESTETFRFTMSALLGGAVSVFVLIMAIYMITRGNRELRQLQNQEVHTHEP